MKTLAITTKMINPIVAKIEALKIKDSATLTEAVKYLSEVNIYLDKVIAYKETKTKPLNQALSIIRKETKPIENILKALIESMRTKMSDYQTKNLAKQAENEQKIADKLADDKIEIGKAIEAMGKVAPVERKIESKAGSVVFIAKDDFEIMDQTMISNEYLIPNETKIRQAMKDGIRIAGIRYFIRQIPRNDR